MCAFFTGKAFKLRLYFTNVSGVTLNISKGQLLFPVALVVQRKVQGRTQQTNQMYFCVKKTTADLKFA